MGKCGGENFWKFNCLFKVFPVRWEAENEAEEEVLEAWKEQKNEWVRGMQRGVRQP